LALIGVTAPADYFPMGKITKKSVVDEQWTLLNEAWHLKG